jgi:hypothetical protein
VTPSGSSAAALREPGAYWREVLAVTVEARGSTWSVNDLLGAVADCDAGLVDVAGWLSDELRMGRMQRVLAGPQLYEQVPGLRSQRHRIVR